MTVLGSLTHSPSFVALHSVSHVPWLISPSSLWRRLSVSYTVSFPQSLVPGPFSSPMKSYLSGCLISPRLQSLYTHDPQSFISRTAQSSVWEPNDCCLLDTSLVSQVPQTSNFQNETTFLPKPLLFLWCPFTSMNWLVRSPSQKFGRYPWLLSLLPWSQFLVFASLTFTFVSNWSTCLGHNFSLSLSSLPRETTVSITVLLVIIVLRFSRETELIG